MRAERTPTRQARLFVDAPLTADDSISLPLSQSHYIRNVLRASIGDSVEIFNAHDGAFAATIETIAKKEVTLRVGALSRRADILPEIWLAFAPIRRERTDFLVEKAVELGVTRLCPVTTRFTQQGRLKIEHMHARMIEACEQSERVGIAEIAPLTPMEQFLTDLPDEALLVFCDEAEAAKGAVKPVQHQSTAPVVVVIGPEGGFHADERARLIAHPGAVSLSLGPRILRAETAALAALTLIQLWAGDWGR